MATDEWRKQHKTVTIYVKKESGLERQLEEWKQANGNLGTAAAVTRILELFFAGKTAEDVGTGSPVPEQVLERVQGFAQETQETKQTVDELVHRIEVLERLASLSGLTESVAKIDALQEEVGGMTKANLVKKLGYESLEHALRELRLNPEDADFNAQFAEALGQRHGKKYRVVGEGRQARIALVAG